MITELNFSSYQPIKELNISFLIIIKLSIIINYKKLRKLVPESIMKSWNIRKKIWYECEVDADKS